MDSITSRILAGEIVLTKAEDGFAAIALTDKLKTVSIIYGNPLLRLQVTATKKDGETVTVHPTKELARTTVEGQDVIKVAVTVVKEETAPVRARTAPRPDAQGFCRCRSEADTHGRCYECGGYQPAADAGRWM